MICLLLSFSKANSMTVVACPTLRQQEILEVGKRTKSRRMECAKILISYNDMEELKRLAIDVRSDSMTFEGETLLHIAARKNDFGVASVLSGFESRDGLGHLASFTGYVNDVDSYKQTPLFWAMCNNNQKMALVFLKNGACNSVNTIVRGGRYSGETPLYLAVRNDDFLIAELLLGLGGCKYINKKVSNSSNGRNYKTPLCLAIDNNNLEMVKILVEHGAEIEEGYIQPAGLSQEVMSYLQVIYNFQQKQSEDKLRLVFKQISKNNAYEQSNKTVEAVSEFYCPTQRTKDMVRLAFCDSFKKILCKRKLKDEDLCDEFSAALFLRLNELAKSHFVVKQAVMQAFEVKDQTLLEKKNIIYFIEHVVDCMKLGFAKYGEGQRRLALYKRFLEDDQKERYNFAFKEKVGNGNMAAVITDDRQLFAPRSFLRLFQ